MYERILVTLDGSQLAEVAIPYVEELAGRLGGEIILLNVCRPEQEPFNNMHEIYLQDMAHKLERGVKKKFPRCEECKVTGVVIAGEPSDVIFDYVEKNDIKMIVMATHGGSGPRVWMLGSVVDKVVRAVNIPTLVIRVERGLPDKVRKGLINRILLPLDGSDAGRTIVPYAAALAKRLKASITLFGMVQKVATAPINYSDIKRIRRMEKEEDKRMRAFIGEVETELRGDGIPVKHVVTLGENAAEEILELGKKVEADLVVVATHGRSAIARWFLGSVAEAVLLEGDLPVLMMRKETA